MFLPKETKFYDLYEALAEKIARGVSCLEELKKDYSQLEKVAKDLNNLEREADDIVHEIYNKLLYDHTRVTEEKGDIKFFIYNMDNIMDSIEKTVNRLFLYQIKKLPQAVIEFLPLLKEATQEIRKGVECLRNFNKKEKILDEYCIRVNDLEDEADKVNRKWLQKIMIEPVKTPNDIRRAMALKEIIDLLEYGMDQCEDVANILETFRLKGES